MFSLEIETLARLLIDEARERNLRIVTAESCTGGLVAGAICSISGASDVFERGFVTEPVARMMAEGALEASNAHISVAITGVAGPHGGTSFKPVGTVHIATARTNHGLMHRQEFFQYETRTEIQLAAVQVALQALRDRMT